MSAACGDDVADVTPPLVVIASPKAGDVVARKSTVTIMVTAGDDSGVLTEVVVFVDSQSQCRFQAPPYRCTWEVPAPRGRSYTLQASARDGSGNEALSAIVRVKADNPVSKQVIDAPPRRVTQPHGRLPSGKPEW